MTIDKHFYLFPEKIYTLWVLAITTIPHYLSLSCIIALQFTIAFNFTEMSIPFRFGPVTVYVEDSIQKLLSANRFFIFFKQPLDYLTFYSTGLASTVFCDSLFNLFYRFLISGSNITLGILPIFSNVFGFLSSTVAVLGMLGVHTSR